MNLVIYLKLPDCRFLKFAIITTIFKHPKLYCEQKNPHKVAYRESYFRHVYNDKQGQSIDLDYTYENNKIRNSDLDVYRRANKQVEAAVIVRMSRPRPICIVSCRGR